MKALTVRNPWAYLIVKGFKKVENRTWQTNYRGRVLIHASKKPCAWDTFLYYLTPRMEEVFAKLCITCEWLKSRQNGVIIGSVEIVDCVVNYDDAFAEQSPGYISGMTRKEYKEKYGRQITYNWILKDPVIFDKPIKAKGGLSLWNFNRKIDVNEEKTKND